MSVSFLEHHAGIHGADDHLLSERPAAVEEALALNQERVRHHVAAAVGSAGCVSDRVERWMAKQPCCTHHRGSHEITTSYERPARSGTDESMRCHRPSRMPARWSSVDCAMQAPDGAERSRTQMGAVSVSG